MTNQFTFHNMLPTTELSQYCNALLSNLMELAPSNATETGQVIKAFTGYRCTIEIYAPFGRFCAIATDRDVETAVKKAVKALKKDLSLWSKNRFAQPSIPQYAYA